jgi:hypothetical protein
VADQQPEGLAGNSSAFATVGGLTDLRPQRIGQPPYAGSPKSQLPCGPIAGYDLNRLSVGARGQRNPSFPIDSAQLAERLCLDRPRLTMGA